MAEQCRARDIPFRTMPGVYELIGGKVSVSRLREVEISDLLRREPVDLDDEAVGRTLTGRRVMVTGGGGSIGLELCRQVARWQPAQLIILGHGENSIFEALLELREDYATLSMIPVIADIRDIERINDVFHHLHPEVVFHAAAHKHVFPYGIQCGRGGHQQCAGDKERRRCCPRFWDGTFCAHLHG